MPGDYLRFGLTAGTIALLQIAAPALTCVLTLLVSIQLYDVVGDNGDYYVFLAVVAGLLYFTFTRRAIAEEWMTFTSSWTVARRVAMSWLAVIAALLLIGYATKVSAVYSRRVLFTWFLITPPLAAAAVMLLRQTFRQMVIRGNRARTAVIAGINDISLQLGRSIARHPELGLTLKGYFDDRGASRVEGVEPQYLLGPFADLPAYARLHRIDVIFVAMPMNYAHRTHQMLRDLMDTTASLYFVPDVFGFDLIQSRSTDLNGIPVVALCETPFYGLRGLAKRITDVALASLMLLLALPVMIAVAIAVRWTTPGSVIFKQRRYGLDGREFVLYKFRTMTASDDGARVRQAQVNDPRVTPLGKFLRRYSLDELPQLINVLKGDMSLVGPRPHAVAHNETYRKMIDGYMVRHKVPPGITGLAQVNGCRGETATLDEMQRRVDYDLEYLRRWSLALDFEILLKTAATVFRNEKAY